MSLSDCGLRLDGAEAEEEEAEAEEEDDATYDDVSTDRSSEIGRLLEQRAMIELCVLARV